MNIHESISSLRDRQTPLELSLAQFRLLGHALGLGHATNLKKSTDLMGYGWGSGYPYTQPVLSPCDVDAIAYAFAWALDGSQPYPPTETFYDCSLD